MQDLATLLFLGALWGGAFPLMRVAGAEFGPFAMVGVRIGLAALLLLPFTATRKNWVIIRQRPWAFFFVGMTACGASFPLMTYSTLHLGAGIGAVLNGLTPVFTSLIAWIWLKQKLSRRQAAGIAVAWLGVALLTANRATPLGQEAPFFLPFAAALLGTFIYGASANLAKVHLDGVSPTLISGGSLLFAAIVDVPLAIFFWPTQAPSPQAWASVFSLGALCTALAYILYFRLVERIGINRAISVTFLVPAFGLLWGGLFLNEALTLQKVAAATVILAGTFLINAGKSVNRPVSTGKLHAVHR